MSDIILLLNILCVPINFFLILYNANNRSFFSGIISSIALGLAIFVIMLRYGLIK